MDAGKRVRALVGRAVIAAGTLALAAPAGAQLRSFDLPAPPSTRAAAGRFTIRWEDRFGDLFPNCLYSITWYYASSPAGEDRKRIVTEFRDDFSGGLRVNWEPQGLFPFDWEVRQERGTGRRFLAAPRQGGPAVSRADFSRDVVLSVLMRPVGIAPEFSIGLRVQPNGRAYEVTTKEDVLRLTQAGRGILGGEARLRGRVSPLEWCWYEIGIQTRRNRDVEIRVRVFDARRERVLAGLETPLFDRPLGGLDGKGLISLTGPAHFAEVYVDPWSARWADDRRNFLVWNTEEVPDGDYYVVAEICDGKRPPVLVASKYQVQVRNRETAAGGNN
jgi:hypothetical protein